MGSSKKTPATSCGRTETTEYTPLVGDESASRWTDRLFSKQNSLLGIKKASFHTRKDSGTLDLPPPATSPCLLFVYVMLAAIAGSVEGRYSTWLGFVHAAMVVTGIASLLVATRYSGRARVSTKKCVHLITVLVWTTTVVLGLVLFGKEMVWKGRENLMSLCLANSGASSYKDIPTGVCIEYANDGTLQRVWIVAILVGVLLGFPLMFVAVRTVYRFYADAASEAAETSTPPKPTSSSIYVDQPEPTSSKTYVDQPV